MTMSDPLLIKLTLPPSGNHHSIHIWCDYAELRCFTHKDKRFSRDALAEAIYEMREIAPEDVGDDEDDEGDLDGAEPVGPLISERNEARIIGFFNQLRWRARVFEDAWPFQLDEANKEIQLKPLLNSQQILYLQLLLSSSLRYVHKKRAKELTEPFEALSVEIFRKLMPMNAEVHAFGAKSSKKYKGHVFDRLTELAKDIRGSLDLKRSHFPPQNSGDSGLDIVAWHPLGDERKNIPVALAQCGCTLDKWAGKMLEASPARLSGWLRTAHPWATYYFMPLDLSTDDGGAMDWQQYASFSQVIVIDRLRLIRLSRDYKIPSTGWSAIMQVTEASAMALT